MTVRFPPKRVTIVGAGGIGQPVIRDVSRTLNHFAPGSVVRVYDGDSFESKNRVRQHAILGENKAAMLGNELRNEHHNIEIEAVPAYVDRAGAAEILARSDVTILAVDNDATRRDFAEQYPSCENGIIITAGVDGVDPAVPGSGYRATAHFHERREGKNVTNPYLLLHALDRDEHPKDRGEVPGCLELASVQNQLLVTNVAAATAVLIGFQLWLNGEKTMEEIVVNCRTGEMYSAWRPLLTEASC